MKTNDETTAPKTTALKPYIVPHIYGALVAVGAELARIGIAKDRQNQTQGFKFRGIDDVMNVVSPILARNDILFLINYQDYPDVDRVTGKGSTLIYARVKGEFTFVSAKDSSSVSVTTYGVAMDSGDKATNKAMSAALKYALLQTFLIPTEGGDDADATTQDASVPAPPAGLDEWYRDEVKPKVKDGFEALAGVWRESRKDYRDYILRFRRDDWEAAKREAMKGAKP